jgi:two-component sensor histidine kinase
MHAAVLHSFISGGFFKNIISHRIDNNVQVVKTKIYAVNCSAQSKLDKETSHSQHDRIGLRGS